MYQGIALIIAERNVRQTLAIVNRVFVLAQSKIVASAPRHLRVGGEAGRVLFFHPK